MKIIKKKDFFSVIFLFLATIAYANDFTVVINGSFPGAEGKKIRLMKYADQITYRHKEIDKTLVDENSSFSFKFNVYEPVYIFYRVDYAQMGHYIEPGNTYEIKFEPVDFDTLDDRRNPFMDPWNFNFELFDENEPGSLNDIVTKFNNIFDDFLLEHFSNILRGRLNKPFEEFREYSDSIFNMELIDNTYFENLYEYKFARFYRIANIKRDNYFFKEYIIDKPVLYENLMYMDFFNTMFDKFLISGSRSIRINDLTTAVNQHNSYYALMDSLGKDTVLRNELLRELVMLKGLKDMYHDRDYSRRNVLSIIRYVKINSKFPQHRDIAANLIHELTHLERGYRAPKLDTRDNDGQLISINDHKGKFVLLHFWTTWCVTCLTEFSVMEELFDEHKENFTFISISVDRDFEDYQRFINTNQYSWDFYHFQDNYALLDRYEVRNFPLFIIIDPEGNIIDKNAEYPSRGLDRRIMRILYNWERAGR